MCFCIFNQLRLMYLSYCLFKAPSAPTNLTLSSMTLAGLTLKWGIPLSINGQLRSFLINIEEVDKFLEEYCCQDFPVMEVPVKTEIPYYETEVLLSFNAGETCLSSYMCDIQKDLWVQAHLREFFKNNLLHCYSLTMLEFVSRQIISYINSHYFVTQMDVLF